MATKWRGKTADDTFSSITKIICVLVLILVDYCVVLMVFSKQIFVSVLHYLFLLFICAWFCCKWHLCDGTNFGPLLRQRSRWLWYQIWPQIIFFVLNDDFLSKSPPNLESLLTSLTTANFLFCTTHPEMPDVTGIFLPDRLILGSTEKSRIRLSRSVRIWKNY